MLAIFGITDFLERVIPQLWNFWWWLNLAGAHKCQNSAKKPDIFGLLEFLIAWFKSGNDSKILNSQVHDHLSQKPPFQIWCCSINYGRRWYMQNRVKCGFLEFFIRQTGFLTRLNNITTFHTSQEREFFSCCQTQSRQFW